MELWGKDGAFRGAVCPAFFSRSGERLPVPEEFQDAVTRISAGVCCVGCRHCHCCSLRRPVSPQTQAARPLVRSRQKHIPNMSDDAKDGDLATIEAILGDPAASFWLKAALLSLTWRSG